MGINWNEAPEGATHHRDSGAMFVEWYKLTDTGVLYYQGRYRTGWKKSQMQCSEWIDTKLTPRPTEPKPYTRDEALQFLVERLDSWPTDIADAPLCPGWGWVFNGNHPEFEETAVTPHPRWFIGIDSWSVARPEFVPFVSLEDAPPVTGQKFDTGKPIIGAIPPHAELAVARVMTFGAQKYARDNWRKIDDIPTRYMDAALRHLNAVRRGETVDPESGEHHLAHAACCILFMLDVVEASNAQTNR